MRIETHEPTVSSGLDIESAGGLCLEPVLLGDGSTKDEDGRAVGLQTSPPSHACRMAAQLSRLRKQGKFS